MFICLIVLYNCKVQAQKLELPIKNEAINYEGFIKTTSDFSNDELCNQTKNWVLSTSKKMNLTILSMKESECSFEVDLSSVLEPDGTFNNITCLYKILITNQNKLLKYTITNLKFSKNQQQYKVDEVYAGYLKNNPITVAGVESRKAALRRHEYILSTLDTKMNTIINSLNTHIINHDVALSK